MAGENTAVREYSFVFFIRLLSLNSLTSQNLLRQSWVDFSFGFAERRSKKDNEIQLREDRKHISLDDIVKTIFLYARFESPTHNTLLQKK